MAEDIKKSEVNSKTRASEAQRFNEIRAMAEAILAINSKGKNE